MTEILPRQDRYHNLLARLVIMTPADLICERVGGIFLDFCITEANWFQCSATNARRELLHDAPYVAKDTAQDALLWVDDIVSRFDKE